MTTPNDLTLLTSKMTSLACSICAAIYAGVGLDPSPIIQFLLTFWPLLTVIMWLQKDAQRTQTVGLLDWGLWLWVGWPIVIPWYGFKTRGRQGWRLVLGLIALILAPYIVGASVAWALYGMGDAQSPSG